MISRVAVLGISIVLLLPNAALASMSMAADAMCNPVIVQCECGMIPVNGQCKMVGPQANKHNCPGICWDTPPGGKVTGTCVAPNDCKGTGTEKGGIGDAKMFGDMMKGLMDMLKQAMQKKEDGDKGQQQQQQSAGTCQSGVSMGANGQCGCTAYYQVTTPTTDPCAYYVKPASENIGGTGTDKTASDLIHAINGDDALNDVLKEEGGTGSSNVSDLIKGELSKDTEEKISDVADDKETEKNEKGAIGSNLGKQAVTIKSGTRGDIEVREGGATVVAQARDEQSNTEVAGFYGGNGSGQPQGIVSNLCGSRPWAKSIVSFVIPPAFFDSLCAWRGFQVGSAEPEKQAPVVEKKKTAPAPMPSPTPPPAAASVPAKVDIWAVPDKVPLGSRTSIFWNTKGAKECTVTSPDGSFNETSLSGGAATVPLSGETTFTISCLSQDGKPSTDFVTVRMAI